MTRALQTSVLQAGCVLALQSRCVDKAYCCAKLPHIADADASAAYVQLERGSTIDMNKGILCVNTAYFCGAKLPHLSDTDAIAANIQPDRAKYSRYRQGAGTCCMPF